MEIRKWLMLVLTLALGGLILGCGGAGVETTAVPATTAVPSVATAVATTVDATVTAPAAGAQLPNPAAVYCQDKGYAYEIRTAADGSQSGVCTLPDGTECDEWAYYRGECGPAQPAPSGTTPGLWLDKTTFEPAEEIQVRFVAPSPPQAGAWVGIIPSDVPHGDEATNDEHDVDYQYLEEQVSGVLTFLAPNMPGAYDFRLHDTDSDGQELASVSFTVLGAPGEAELRLDKTEFEPGEEILVHFSTSGTFANDAWLGIIPAEVPHGSEATNDQYDLAYEYLDGQAEGVLTFVAPSEPGSYDLRLHDTDSDGREVASVPFTVLGGPEKAELWLDKTSFAPGEEMQVHFTALATFSSGAWVGIIPSDVPHGSAATNDEYDLDYEYLEGQVSGVLSFLAPMEPGSYDLRMQDSDSSDGLEVASVTFEVSGN